MSREEKGCRAGQQPPTGELARRLERRNTERARYHDERAKALGVKAA